jgi:hypothetical protein
MESRKLQAEICGISDLAAQGIPGTSDDGFCLVHTSQGDVLLTYNPFHVAGCQPLQTCDAEDFADVYADDFEMVRQRQAPTVAIAYDVTYHFQC